MVERELRQAVILAGGRGERLRPITDSLPKPMASIGPRPFLDYLIRPLVNQGITEVLFLLGYKGHVIFNRYSSATTFRPLFSWGSANDETGRRLLNAYNLLDDHFLLVYGDNYCQLTLNDLWENYNKVGNKVQTTVFSNINGTGEYGVENNIAVGKDGVIQKHDKTRQSPECNGVDIGYFIVAKTALPYGIKQNISFEEIVLPRLVENSELIGYVSNQEYHYITDMLSLESFKTTVLKENIRPIDDAGLNN